LVTVYDWQTGKRLTPAANNLFAFSKINPDYLVLQKFSVVSY
jgi:hypothetical protein